MTGNTRAGATDLPRGGRALPPVPALAVAR